MHIPFSRYAVVDISPLSEQINDFAQFQVAYSVDQLFF